MPDAKMALLFTITIWYSGKDAGNDSLTSGIAATAISKLTAWRRDDYFAAKTGARKALIAEHDFATLLLFSPACVLISLRLLLLLRRQSS